MSAEIKYDQFLSVIMSRRSLRRYRMEPVPHDLIKQVLTAAIWAPSAHNRQPWRFAAVERQETKELLARAMGARLRQDLEADHAPEEIIEKDVGRSYDRLVSAPVLIVLCLSMIDMNEYRDARRNHYAYIMAVQSAAMAGQNLLLAAHHLGLGACWMCAPLFCPEVVQQALALPSDWQPQGIITLGDPDQEREKTRHPLEKMLLWK